MPRTPLPRTPRTPLPRAQVTASALAAVEGAAAETELHQQQQQLTGVPMAETELQRAARLAGRIEPCPDLSHKPEAGPGPEPEPEREPEPEPEP